MITSFNIEWIKFWFESGDSLLMRQELAAPRRREKFTPSEDDRLRHLVEENGMAAWESIAAEMPGRNVRQCRERWKHYLSINNTKLPWTDMEDNILFEKMQEVGPKWTKLTQYLPKRTDIQIKARWMQKFADGWPFHVRNRPPKMPQYVPQNQCVVGQYGLPQTYVFPGARIVEEPVKMARVQFAQQIPQQIQAMPVVEAPRVPTPEHEHEMIYDLPRRDSSFGSRSFMDFMNWN